MEAIIDLVVEKEKSFSDALDYLLENGILTYPVLIDFVLVANLRRFHWWLLRQIQTVRRIDAKGYVLHTDDPDFEKRAIEEINKQFAEDISMRIDYYRKEGCIYKEGEYNGRRYFFLKQEQWPSRIQKIAYYKDDNGLVGADFFTQDSLSFEVLAELIQSPTHTLTYLQLYQLMESLGIYIDGYEFGAIYRWFWYLQKNYKYPLVSSRNLGWGLVKPTIQDENEQKKEVRQRLNESYARRLIEDQEKNNYSFIGAVGDITYYFPNHDMGLLPRHCYIIVQEKGKEKRVIDFGTQTTVRRMLESIVRNEGYCDIVTLSNSQEEDWWKNQTFLEAQISKFLAPEINHRQERINLKEPEAYFYGISELNMHLKLNNLPLLIPGKEVGYSLESSPITHDDFVNHLIKSALKPIANRLPDDAELKQCGILANKIYYKENVQIIIFDPAKLSQTYGYLYQPATGKPFGALMIVTFYNLSGKAKEDDFKQESLVFEISQLQAQLLLGMNGSTKQQLPALKQDADSIREIIRRLSITIKKFGFNIKMGTGTVNLSNGIVSVTLPIPELRGSVDIQQQEQ